MRSRAEALMHRSGQRRGPGDSCVVGLGSKGIRLGRRVAGSGGMSPGKMELTDCPDRCGRGVKLD